MTDVQWKDEITDKLTKKFNFILNKSNWIESPYFLMAMNQTFGVSQSWIWTPVHL